VIVTNTTPVAFHDHEHGSSRSHEDEHGFSF
jgi:hypothetical protein